jgi:hypothetical protein
MEVKKMKKIISMLVLAVFIISMVPLAAAEETEAVATVAMDEGAEPVEAVVISAQPTITDKQLVAERPKTRLERCVEFLSEYPEIKYPKLRCSEIIRDRDKCVKFLEAKNVTYAEKKCNSIFMEALALTRTYIGERLVEEAPEWRLKRLDYAVQQREQYKDFVQELSEEKVRVFLHMPIATQKRILEENATEKLEAFNLQKVKTINMFKKRVIAVNKLELAKERFQVSKEKFVTARERVKEKNAELAQIKNRFRECQDVDTEECDEIRAKTLEHAKAILTNSAEAMIAHLEKIKEKVEANDDLSEEEAEKIIEDIDVAIERLQNAIDRVEAAETIEEVKEAGKEIKKVWLKFKPWAKRHAARVLHAALGDIIVRSEHLENKLMCSLDAMEEQGIEVSDLEAKVEEFSDLIDNAKEKHAEAMELFKEAAEIKTETPTDEEAEKVSDLVQQAQELLKEARASLKEAHVKLVEIVKGIREAGGKITPCEKEEGLEEDEEYVVVEETGEEESEEEEE